MGVENAIHHAHREYALGVPPRVLKLVLRTDEELYADGRADFNLGVGRFQCAAILVDLKHAHVVAVLAADDHPLAAGIDAKVARHLDVLALMTSGGELASSGIDLEDRNAVVSAIADVDELAGAVDLHFGGRIAFDLLGQRVERVKLG